MTYINEAFNGQNLWNVKGGGGGPTSDMFSINLGYTSTMVTASIGFQSHQYQIVMNGNFAYTDPVLTLANVKGLSTSFTIYRDGLLNEYVSSSEGLDFMAYAVDIPDLLRPLLTGNDVFNGSITSDQDDGVQSFEGNDTFTGYGSGEYGDSFYGGSGIDTSVYRGKLAEYTISSRDDLWDDRFDDGTRFSGIRIEDKIINRDGFDDLNQVERLRFSDTSLALDVAKGENAGMAYRIYKAAFDRTPDAEGLGFWINALDQGYSLEQVASAVMTSPEFQSVYGANSSNYTFVNLLYQHVLHREADSEGFSFWNNALNAGYGRGAVLAVYTECPETIAQTAQLVASGIQYQAWQG